MKPFHIFLSLFKKPTLQEIIQQELAKETQAVAQCDNVIMAHKFQRHMSLAAIKALIEWNNRYNLKG